MQSMTLQQAFDSAIAHQRSGELAEAESLFRQLIEINPANPAFHYALFTLFYQCGRMDEALATLDHALTLRPDEPLFLCMRGDVLGRLRRITESKAAFARSLALQPHNPETHFRLANALAENGNPSDAIVEHRKALALRPDYPEAFSNLASVLTQLGDLDQAMSVCREGLAMRPDFQILYRNLGWACRESGLLDDAIAAYRHAIALRPDHHAHGDLLFTLHFHPDYDRARLADEHRHWYQLHAAPLQAFATQAHHNDPSPHRRLKIGYVANDLGDRPLGRLLLPLLANHDPAQVETFCYCNIRLNDVLEAQLISHTGTWRLVSGISDRALADQIRHDRIDVLVDLNLHTAGNRLLTFALKPAPVQVTYLAYPSTTGLPTIDYRFTDHHLDPPGSDESVYTEKSVRLRTYWCYPPLPQAPPVGPLPALSNGHVTFGCLNDYAKVTPAVRSLWARLLQSLPTSRLLLHTKSGSHRSSALEHFAAHGIHPARLQLVGRLPIHQYFALYNQLDIALDPHPWAGGATTCDALYMGVPVVTLAAEKAVSRGGLSILSNVGLPHLAATNPEQYLHTARALATDLPALATLRAALRQMIQTSPLMNGPAFARDVESAYRQMWLAWCHQHTR
jgi:predicted O-linked N-acetylglucosamine transferase (SPINDLY family)